MQVSKLTIMPNKKRGSGKRRPKNRRRNNPRGYVGAPVAGLSVPKPYLSLAAAGTAQGSNIFRASGCEMIAQVTSTQNYTVFRANSLNPGNSNLAPRLQSMAMMFEKYRFLRFSAEYHPGCPTTQSGSIGLMVDFDPTDASPPSLVHLAQNECASVGTVAFPLKIDSTFNSNDPWYYVTTMTANPSAVSQWEHQGRFFICTDQASSGDSGKFAGYVSISYEIEFLRLRPVAQIVAAGSVGPKSVTGGASLSSQVMDVIWTNVVGWYETNSSAPVFAIEDQSVNGDSVARLGAGVWDAAIDLVLGSGVSSSSSKTLKSVTEDDEKHLRLGWSDDDEKVEVQPPRVWTYWNPKYCKSSGHCDLETKSVAMPAAAGDVSVSLVAYDVVTAATSAITTMNISGGTTAQSVAISAPFTLNDPSLLYVQVTPTGVETRAVTSGHVGYINLTPQV